MIEITIENLIIYQVLDDLWLAELTKVIKKHCLIPPSFLPILFCFLDYLLLSLLQLSLVSRKLHLWPGSNYKKTPSLFEITGLSN